MKTRRRDWRPVEIRKKNTRSRQKDIGIRSRVASILFIVCESERVFGPKPASRDRVFPKIHGYVPPTFLSLSLARRKKKNYPRKSQRKRKWRWRTRMKEKRERRNRGKGRGLKFSRWTLPSAKRRARVPGPKSPVNLPWNWKEEAIAGRKTEVFPVVNRVL